ncbi:MAG: hypothetical protein ACJ74Y_17450, partial [Bryobacteraceae bacterium]
MKGPETAPPGKHPTSSAGSRTARRPLNLIQDFPLFFFIALLSTAISGLGQMMLKPLQPGEPITLLPGDAAVFESPEFRKGLPCTVSGRKAELGFDLRFHSGYDVTIPIRELAGDGGTL